MRMIKHGVVGEKRKNFEAFVVSGDSQLSSTAIERLRQIGIGKIEKVDMERGDIAIDSSNGSVFKLVNIIPGDINKEDTLSALGGSPTVQPTKDNRSLR